MPTAIIQFMFSPRNNHATSAVNTGYEVLIGSILDIGEKRTAVYNANVAINDNAPDPSKVAYIPAGVCVNASIRFVNSMNSNKKIVPEKYCVNIPQERPPPSFCPLL